MLNMVKRLFVEEDGQGMTEYALVLGVIAIGAVVIITAFRNQVIGLYETITTELSGI